MLRSSSPDIAAFVLDLVSLNYHEAPMVGFGICREGTRGTASASTREIPVVVEGAYRREMAA